MFGTCCHLISRTVMLVVNSSSRALRLGSWCKPTHKRRIWELCLSGALQILDLIDWLIDCERSVPNVLLQSRKSKRHPPVQSRLEVTNRSFRCAAPLFWNKLPHSLRIPYQADPTHSSSLSSSPDPRSAVNLPHGVFHSRLKTHLFSKSFPP